MVFEYDPRSKKDGLSAKSFPTRLLEDILTEQIVAKMASGTASNYITHAYGSNHRILYEGAARLLASIILSSTDHIEDMEYSQMRAEFISTRLLYSVFPSDDEVPEGDNIGEVIDLLLKTYSALLEGSSKLSVDKALNQIDPNTNITSTLEGYLATISSSILAVTEENTTGAPHRHYAFTNEKGLGTTNKPLGFRWGDEIHQHEIIDGVVQPYVNSEGVSHTHEVYLGLPENILRLQTNLRKVFEAIKPAHIKTGEVTSILEEGGQVLASGKPDGFAPILGLDSALSESDVLISNSTLGQIDENHPYYNEVAEQGLVGLSLGSLYQEDMRRALPGTEPSVQYGYASGRTLRFWRSGIEVADNLLVKWEVEVIDPDTGVTSTEYRQQRLRVISVSSETPSDRDGFTLSFVRSLGTSEPLSTNISALVSGVLTTTDVQDGVRVGALHNPLVSVRSGEPVQFSDTSEVFFTEIKGYEVAQGALTPSGTRYGLSAVVVEVDASLLPSGLVKVQRLSSAWESQSHLLYDTLELTKGSLDVSTFELGSLFQSRAIPSILGLPLSFSDLTFTLFRSGAQVDLAGEPLFLDLKENVIRSENGVFAVGDHAVVVFPTSKGELRSFSELNDLSQTLNAIRQPRYSFRDSVRGELGNNRVKSWVSDTSFVLNGAKTIKPFTRTEKKATYSVSNSDLLNNENQTLNSAFVLNRGALGLNLSQDQVFKPATKTITTSNSTINFSQLGFKPTYVTSIEDSEGTSYSFLLTSSGVVVLNLEAEKTLTINAISSTPLVLDQDWFKGEVLAEGQSFLELQNLDVENTPEEIHQDPLGMEDGQNRSKYALREIEESGNRGELAFYEDTLTRYELDGRDGFSNEVDPFMPSDVLLGHDYSIYQLGPLVTTETQTYNTIPTYLYFTYAWLNLFGGDGHYVALYRLDGNGVRYYQTLTPIADGNGFFALEEYPSLPAPNGAPLAYRFRDDGSGGGFALNYTNGSFADNYSAQINASFNHVPFQTYYLEVFMEEDGGGADFLYFFSQGTNAPYVLNTSWDTSAETYRLDSATPSGFGGVTYTYAVTFATNPGEVTSFNLLGAPPASSSSEVESVGALHTIGVEGFGLSEYLYGIRYSMLQTFPSPWFVDVESEYPFIDDFSEARRFYDVLPSDLRAPTDFHNTSLYLYPSNIEEGTEEIRDDLTTLLSIVSSNQTSSLPAPLDEHETTFVFATKDLESEVGALTDGLEYSLALETSALDEVSLTDTSSAWISSASVSSEVSGISDSHDKILGLQSSLESEVGDPTDEFTHTLQIVDVEKISEVSAPMDAFTHEYLYSDRSFSSSSLGALDEVDYMITLNKDLASDVGAPEDLVDAELVSVFVDNLPTILDDHEASMVLTFDWEDSVSKATDLYTTSYLLFPSEAQDSVVDVQDDLDYTLSLSINLDPDEVSVSAQGAISIVYDFYSTLPQITDDTSHGLTLSSNLVERISRVQDSAQILFSEIGFQSDVGAPTDDHDASILLEKSVDGDVGTPTDSDTRFLNLTPKLLESEVNATTDDFTHVLNLFGRALVSTLPQIEDVHAIELTRLRELGSTLPLISDDSDSLITLFSSRNERMPRYQDALDFSLSLEKSVASEVDAPLDGGFEDIFVGSSATSSIPSASDDFSFSQSFDFISDDVAFIGDGITHDITLVSNGTSEVGAPTDEFTHTLTLSGKDLTSEVGAPLDAHTFSLSLSEILADSTPSITDDHTTNITILKDLASTLSQITDDFTHDLTLSGKDLISSVSAPLDAHDHALALVSDQTSEVADPTDDSTHLFEFTPDEGVSVVSAVLDEADYVEPFTVPYIYMALNYNSFSLNDKEFFSIYTGEQETLEYPLVVSKMPDSQGLTAYSITEQESGEVTVQSIINSTYSNTSDALIRVGPLDPAKNYKIYASTEFDDGVPPDMNAAIHISTSAIDPHNLQGLSFFELFPDSVSNGTDVYYIHNLDFQTSQSLKVTPGSAIPFTFTKNEIVRLYFYMKYQYSGTQDDSDAFRFRPAPANATYLDPNGSDGSNDDSGWYAPMLHSVYGYTYNSSTKAILFPNFSDINSNNEAQLSWAVEVGVRYQLQLNFYADKNNLPLYLESRTEDNGASYNTEYDFSSALPYAEIVPQTNQRNLWNHFFTVRRDGFIIWELAPEPSL